MPRKRPRAMPQLSLQQTPKHIKLRRPCRIPTTFSNSPDPIATPVFTPGDEPLRRISTPRQFTPLAQTPPSITPARVLDSGKSVRPQSAEWQRQSPSQWPSSLSQGVEWSGGLYSGHKSLTLESLHPTPPSGATNVFPKAVTQKRDLVADARVRRLSFGPEVEARTSVKTNAMLVVRKKASAEEPGSTGPKEVSRTRHGPGEGDAPPCVDLEDRVQIDNNDASKGSLNFQSNDDITEECSQQNERNNHVLLKSVSPFPDSQPDESSRRTVEFTRGTAKDVHTPVPKLGTSELRTPENTAVRRCQAPRWDGPISEVPETPLDQLPPRQAPRYLVKTVVTAPGELSSLPELPSSTPILGSSSEGRKMGLLWMDIGRSDSKEEEGEDGLDDTRPGNESDSASTEPPSPIQVRHGEEDKGIGNRAQLFCRRVRVSIPVGGFRSPSPEPTPPHM